MGQIEKETAIANDESAARRELWDRLAVFGLLAVSAGCGLAALTIATGMWTGIALAFTIGGAWTSGIVYHATARAPKAARS